MKHSYDIKDDEGNRIRVNLNEGMVTGIPTDEKMFLEQKELKEIENRIQKMLQRYIPKAIQEAKEKGDIKW